MQVSYLHYFEVQVDEPDFPAIRRRVVRTVGSRRAQVTLGALLDQVEHTHQPVTITRYGRPSAVLVSAEQARWLDLIESDPEVRALLDAVLRQRSRGR